MKKEKAYTEKIEILDQLFQNNHLRSDKPNIINELLVVINALSKFHQQVNKNRELPSPTQLYPTIELGENDPALFNGLFGIEITGREPSYQHNLSSSSLAILSKISCCEKELRKSQTQLQSSAGSNFFVLNNIVHLLSGYGVIYEWIFQSPTHVTPKLAYKIKNLMNAILFEVCHKIFACTPQDKIHEKIKAHEIVEHIKGCYLAVSVVKHYTPYSIDYFMMNLEQFAPYEFYDLKNIQDDTEKKNKVESRIKDLHKYTKFIIADVLMGNLDYVYPARDEHNYLRRLLWHFGEYAHFHDMKFEDYVEQHVDMITFNYDLSFELMLYDYLSIDAANKFNAGKGQRKAHVYGAIYLDIRNENTPRYRFPKHAIWTALYNLDKKVNAHHLQINEMDSSFLRFKPPVLCEDLLGQIDRRINWIGEKKDEEIKSRESFQTSILKADQIFFLGFGFDFNNLFNLGLIDKQYQLEAKFREDNKLKKIFISGGNAKIINNIKLIFKIEKQAITEGVYYLKSEINQWEFFISTKLLPEALKEDL